MELGPNKQFTDIPKKWRDEWARNPAVRAEFENDELCFYHFKQAEAEGRFRILGSEVPLKK